MKKESNENQIQLPKNEVTMIDYFNKLEKGGDRILKLKLSTHEYTEATDIFLVLEKSLKLNNLENGESEVIMLDAFYKNSVIDIKTIKNLLTPWNFRNENIEKAKIKILDDYCLVKRVFSKNSKVEDLSETLTKEELLLQNENVYANKFLKIGNDESVNLNGYDAMIVPPIY